MTYLVTAIFEKPGATFASAEAASDDRFIGADPALLAQTAALHASFLADGIMSAPPSKTWDQATNTLTVVKYLTDFYEYDTPWSPIGTQLNAVAEGNGWSLVSKEVSEQ